MPRLNLQDVGSQIQLEQHVKTTQPVLLILETFYLLAGGVKEKNEDEVKPILEFLANLSYKYQCSVVLSHHFHKSKEEKRFVDRVSGSGIFGRWYESALFVERYGKDIDNSITVHSSHRDGVSSEFTLRIEWSPEDDGSTLEIEHIDTEDWKADAKGEIMNLMENGFVVRKVAAELLGVAEETLKVHAPKLGFRHTYRTVDSKRRAVLEPL